MATIQIKSANSDNQALVDNTGHLYVTSGGSSGLVDTNLTEVGGAAITLGQKLMSSSIPVVLASDQSTVLVSDVTTHTLLTLIDTDLLAFKAANHADLTLIDSDLLAFKSANHTDLVTINSTIGTGNSSLASIDSKLTTTNSTLATISTTASTIASNQTNGSQITQVTGNVTVIQPAGANLHVDIDNFPSIQPVSGTVTANQGTPNSLANGWPIEITDGTNILGTVAHPVRIDPTGTTIQPVSGTVTANAGTGTFTVGQATAANLNATVVQSSGANLHVNVDSAPTTSVTQGTSPWVENVSQFGGSNVVTGTGASGAGIPRVTVSNDSNILATQSGTWNINNITGTVSLPTGASTAANQTTTNASLSSIDGKLVDNYGSATGALRTASQIGNTTGQADFNAGTSGAQTLRTTSNITRNGTELSYNIGANDANTLRVAANLSNSTGLIDYNYGTVGAQTVRTASEIGNATGAAAFNAGTTGAQVLRAVLPTDQTGINSFLDKTATGALTALNQTVSISTNGMTTATTQILGTFNAVLTFQASVDSGVTWFSVSGIYLNSNLIPINQLNSTGQMLHYVGGYTNFRVIVGTYVSGTINVVINTGTGSLGNIATQFVRLSDNIGQFVTSTTIGSKQNLDVASQGNVATASADSGNPVKIGGVYLTTRPSLTTGQRGDAQVDTRGAFIVTSEDVDPANLNITVQDTASTSTTVANGQVAITGTPTVGSTATFALSSDQSVTLQASGTWTGTLQVEVSMDGGVTYFARPVHQTGTIYTFPSFTANFTGGCNTSGYTHVRVRAIAAMTGTATINTINTDNLNTVYIANEVQSAPVDGIKQSFSASITGLVAAATPTDIFTITGSATKTIRVTRISFSGTQNTSAARDILLIKRSAANTGGTSTTPTAIPHDSTNLAATATVRAYTANPSALGTAVGTIRSKRIQLLATNVTNPLDSFIWDFGNRPSQAIVLRGTSEVLAINLNAITSSNNLIELDIEWTEE